MNSEEHRETRYRLPDEPVTSIAVNTSFGQQVVQARLLELSRGGARVGSESLIPTGESFRLRLTAEELGMDFYASAEVRWIKPGDDQPWLLGCALNPELPERFFDSLVRGGLVERRHDSCADEELGLSAYWNLDGEKLPVTLTNYSQGGFCVFCPGTETPFERFHLLIEKQIVVAQPQWCLTSNDGVLVGCSFLNLRDFERLDEAVKAAIPSTALL